MKPSEALEEHFWKLFNTLPKALFKELAEMDEKRYLACTQYIQGERKRRPMNRHVLLSTRARLLTNLDDHERTCNLGIIV